MHDLTRQVIDDRRREREAEARNERLAVLARQPPARVDEGRARPAFLGWLVAARRHALR